MVARARISDSESRNEANLRRATSDLYYAVFHSICEALVEPLGLHPENPAFIETYTALYRQLDHSHAERKCRSLKDSGGFSHGIIRFSDTFILLKNKREAADYHPLEKFALSAITNDLDRTETHIENFWKVDAAERAAFACYVGLRFSKGPQKTA